MEENCFTASTLFRPAVFDLLTHSYPISNFQNLSHPPSIMPNLCHSLTLVHWKATGVRSCRVKPSRLDRVNHPKYLSRLPSSLNSSLAPSLVSAEPNLPKVPMSAFSRLVTKAICHLQLVQIQYSCPTASRMPGLPKRRRWLRRSQANFFASELSLALSRLPTALLPRCKPSATDSFFSYRLCPVS